MEAITLQWERIEAQLQKHPALDESSRPFLKPGATEEEIASAESAMGVRFPEDYRASLGRHNGQARGEVLLGIGPLLSTQETIEQWRVWKELLDEGSFEDDAGSPDPGVKADWWNPRWIPITHDGGGDHDCVDMDPAEGGVAGQIIEMWHDDDVRPLRAPSFLSWLTAAASGLEDGTLVWDEERGFVSKQQKQSTVGV
jgi:cell wall assembly regulator SMI1